MRLRHHSVPLLLALCALSLSSCGPKLGWGLLLWPSPGSGLHTGDIVPVHLSSSIGKVYIIGDPSSSSTRYEVEQWRIELCGSKRQAGTRRAGFGEYLDTYMSATRDGVPLREKPSNAARRVFRLKSGQSVKVLAPVEGEVVATGGVPLPGAWFQVMADDGTKGYAFSYAMKLYSEGEEMPLPAGDAASADDASVSRLDSFFATTWRPDWFRTMIDSGSIDPESLSPLYGLFADAVKKQIRIELPGSSLTFGYTDITEDGRRIVFEGSGLTVSFLADDHILARWTRSQPQSQEFVIIAEDLRALVAGEEAVQADRLLSLVSRLAAATGEPATSRSVTLRSTESGTLTLNQSGRFSWTGRQQLPAGLIPEGSGEGGRVVMRFLPDESIADVWDGSVSFSFGAERRLDCLYKIREDGFVLARAASLTGAGRIAAEDTTVASLSFPFVSAP